MPWESISLDQRPHLHQQVQDLTQAAWPRFLLHGDIGHWGYLHTSFPEFQILLRDGQGRVAAVGHTAPLVWDGTLEDLPRTMDGILVRALQAREQGEQPNTLSAMAALVAPDQRRQGLSSRILGEMRALAARAGCSSLIAPVRPTWKERYPLIPMAHYVRWVREDGAPFDPWIRVHWRSGARPLQVAPNTLTVTGTLAQWEAWTGMAFPASGRYTLPGALQPVIIDHERDLGRYEDPNLWMEHPISGCG